MKNIYEYTQFGDLLYIGDNLKHTGKAKLVNNALE